MLMYMAFSTGHAMGCNCRGVHLSQASVRGSLLCVCAHQTQGMRCYTCIHAILSGPLHHVCAWWACWVALGLSAAQHRHV